MGYRERMQFADAIEAYSEAIIAWDRTALDPHSTQEQIDLTTRLYTTTRTHLFGLVVQATPILDDFIHSKDMPRDEETASGATAPQPTEDFVLVDLVKPTGPNNTSVKFHPFIVKVKK